MTIVDAVQIVIILMTLSSLAITILCEQRMLDLIIATEIECRTPNGVITDPDKIPPEVLSMSNTLIDLCVKQTKMLCTRIKLNIVLVGSLLNLICFLFNSR